MECTIINTPILKELWLSTHFTYIFQQADSRVAISFVLFGRVGIVCFLIRGLLMHQSSDPKYVTEKLSTIPWL